MNTNTSNLEEKKIVNTVYQIEDLLYGDSKIVERTDYKELDYFEIQKAVKLLLDNKNLSEDKKKYFLANTWSIFYKQKPPTPQEFLAEKYIGATANSIYPHIKSIFETFLNPKFGKNTLILSTSIGTGKTLLSVLIIMYIITHMQLMRNPKKYFGVNPATSFAISLLCFTQKQGNKLLLKPFKNLLISSPFFLRARDEVSLFKKQKDYPDKVVYTTASQIGDLQFSNDIHIMVESDRSGFLGLSVIAGICSEISFWVERGISPDEIWRTYTDLRQRIISRFGTKYLTATILDSSPFDLEKSPIDKYIYQGDAIKDDNNLVIHTKHWDIFGNDPDKYPIYSKTGETFPVFRGYSGRLPKILLKDEVSNYDSVDLYNVPIDLKKEAENNLPKILKDYCAYPSGGLDRLFPSNDSIERLFSYQLRNILTYITASAKKQPEKLIWDQIKDKFFFETNGQYQFYRSHFEKRYIGVDQSFAKDITSIGMLHPEVNNRGEIILVTDFTIVIIPTADKINLDAIGNFILDLKYEGNIDIEVALFDGFQSEPVLQRLDRAGIKIKKDSVDKDIAPYLTFTSWCLNSRFKVGKNIFLKNNFKSIRETERETGTKKIDHLHVSKIVYDDGAEWKTSMMGYGGKDVTDCLCNPAYYCINNFKGVPRYQWEDDNDSISNEILEKGKTTEELSIKIKKAELVKIKKGVVDSFKKNYYVKKRTIKL